MVPETKWFRGYRDVVLADRQTLRRKRRSAHCIGPAVLAGPMPCPPDHGMLTLNNVEVVYDSVILVLKGISLTAAKARSPRCWGPTAPEKPPR